MWTVIAAAVCWFVVLNQVYALWKNVRTSAASGHRSKGKGSPPVSIVFLIVFAAIAGILTAHAIAGRVLTLANGLPAFALGLPTAALLVAVGCVVSYFVGRRESTAPLMVAIVFGLAGALFMWAMTQGEWVNAATGS